MKKKSSVNCLECEYKDKCKEKWGNEFEAIIGTHFCRKSWDSFIDLEKRKKNAKNDDY